MGVKELFNKAVDYIMETRVLNKAYYENNLPDDYDSSAGQSMSKENVSYNGVDKLELAWQAFGTFGVGSSVKPQYIKAVNDFLKNTDSRIDALKKIAELCEGSKTPKALYIKTKAYSWAGATCRKETIQNALEYLNGAIWKDLPSNKFLYNGAEYDQRLANLADIWLDLAKAYEGEKEYENSLKALEKVKSLNSNFPGVALLIAGVYKKMNKLDKAIETLEIAKRDPQLKPRKWKDEWGFEQETSDYRKMFDADLTKYKELYRDQCEYNKILKILPDLAPKSLSGYRRMKSIQSSNYLNILDVARNKGVDL